jgi:hypothetical protein
LPPYAFDAALQGALAAGTVTSDLTAALNNRRAAWAHRSELLMVGVIIVLMVLKPL